MNEQIKQRLVGAVVLVSLAVIFIPMLLDGGDSSSMPRFGSNVPEQPEFDFEPLEIPLEPIEPISEARPRVIEKPEPEESVAAVEEPKPSKPLVQKMDSAPTTEPAQPKVVKPGLKGEPVAWVVQLGSFGQSSNALALRDKLRKNGFTAFVEKYRDKDKTSYRVRVGPELKRETAEKHLSSIESKLKLKGIIMGHP